MSFPNPDTVERLEAAIKRSLHNTSEVLETIVQYMSTAQKLAIMYFIILTLNLTLSGFLVYKAFGG